MDRPSFLVLGAPKCGTSSLCHYLQLHPDVFVPRVKEPVFFDAEYERGIDYYWRTYFSEWAGERAAGEGRVFLLYLPFVPDRIRESLPDARLIAILRNPVDRAYSHWWHRYTYRNEDLPFEEAIEANLERIARGVDFEGPDGPELWERGLVYRGAFASRYRIYLDCGLYAGQIRRYRERFAAEQLRVVFYDDLKRDPDTLVRELWDFIGVSKDAELTDLAPRNEARTTMQSRLRRRTQRVLETTGLRRLLPAPLKRLGKGLFPEREVERPPLDARRHASGCSTTTPSPTAELEALLGRDLSAWRR